MVVGNGLVAKAFNQYLLRDDVLIYASGVSNSKEADPGAFAQEVQLIEDMLAAHPEKTFVYFSTTSVGDASLKDKQYVRHKLYIESLIAGRSKAYHIFRISNIAGRTPNPHTIINFFVNQITTGQPFVLWKSAYRNIIDIDDVLRITSHMIDHNERLNDIVNIAYPENISVPEIVHAIEDFLQKKGNYTLEDFGENYICSTENITSFFSEEHIDPVRYLQLMLKKYIH